VPDPFVNQLVSSVWSAVKYAVTSGLAMEVAFGTPSPGLDSVASVTTEEMTETKPADWHAVHSPDAPAEVRARVHVEQAGNVFDVIHHYDLSYHELRAPDTGAIKRWAAGARQFELMLMLRHYARQAAREPCPAGRLSEAAQPDGWGQRRCVVFKSASQGAIIDRCRGTDMESAVVNVDARPVNGIDALIFRLAGGPYVRRPADLALAWTPAAGHGAELLLTEQLEFVNVGDNGIIGIELTPFP
jgi:hypothetical protein